MALLPGAGWVVLCFRHGLCDDVLRPLPCSSVGGLHCTGQTNARQSQWENVISCAGGQVFLVRLGGASSAVQAVHVATGCSVKEGSSISVSFWHGGAGSRSRNGLFCVPWARCTRAWVRIFFVKNLLSSWWTGVGVALALILARLLLWGCCPLVPRNLLPVLWVAVRDLG